MRKSVIFLTFFSIAGFLFSQTAMQLLTSIESPFADDTFSWSWGANIKGGGDVDGDGYNDIVLAGKPLGSVDGRREVQIHLGGSPLNTEPDYIIPDPSEALSFSNFNTFAKAIAYNGDLNGDGYCDLVVSDCSYGFAEWGRVYVYFGGPDFDTIPDLILDGLDYGSQTETYGLNFGFNIDISGDFNGDGLNDLVVSSSHGNLLHYGQVDIFFGGPDFDTVSDWHYYGEILEQFGYSLSVGDLNGDGYSDLVASSINNQEVDNQEIKLFFGSADFDNICDAIYGGFDMNSIIPLMDTDFNNDSYDDLLIYDGHANEFKICWGSVDVELDFEICHTPPPTNIRSPYTARFEDSRYLCYGTPQLETFNFYRWDNDTGFTLDYTINENYNPSAGGQQSYYLGDVNGDGHNEILLSNRTSNPIQFNVFTTKDESDSIDDNVLTSPLQLTAYPNPFTQQTALTYDLKEPGMIGLSVYNVKGQLVATLDDGFKGSGQHSVIWDGKDSKARILPSGVYLIRLKLGKRFITSKKVTLCC